MDDRTGSDIYESYGAPRRRENMTIPLALPDSGPLMSMRYPSRASRPYCPCTERHTVDSESTHDSARRRVGGIE